MKKAINIAVLLFYAFGAFCLPMGDFAMLKDLPQLYIHCKTTEDKNLNPIGYLARHYLSAHPLTSKHSKGDPQKPHAPIHNHHHGQKPVSHFANLVIAFTPTIPVLEKPSLPMVNTHPTDYITKIFRPPTA